MWEITVSRYRGQYPYAGSFRCWIAARQFNLTAFRECLSKHPRKIFLETAASGIDWLGWVNFPDHCVLRTKTKRRMLKRIKQNPREETLQSYLGLLSHGNATKLKEQLLSEHRP